MYTTLESWKSKPEPIGIIITLPKSVSWEDYELELAEAANGAVMNYKLSAFPKIKKGDRCYVCHDGAVKGFMLITGFSEKSFTCTTTGKHWNGKFIERSGSFQPVEFEKPMKGFMGFRYIYEEL